MSSLLSASEEIALATSWQTTGDLSARNRLVVANRGLVFAIAKRMRRRDIRLEDLVGEGTLGLILAADRFDGRKARFSTYATWWIRAYIISALVRFSGPLKANKRDWWKSGHRSVSTDKIAELVGDEEAADVGLGTVEEYAAMFQAVHVLEPRLRTIVRCRYLEEPSMTLEQVGRSLGLTRERVRQLEVKALAELRKMTYRKAA